MMKNSRQIEYVTLMTLASTMLFLVGCSVGIQGSGVGKTESRNVDEFQSIAHDSVGKISVTVGPPQNISITFDDNLIDLVETQVVDGELRIFTKSSFNSQIGLKVEISLPTLKSCKLSGVGSMDIAGLAAENFKASISGVGAITAAGTAKNLDLKLSGVGNAKMEELLAESVTVTVSGVGNATVYASDSIDAKTSGVGGVTVFGNPTNRQTKSTGIGKIKDSDRGSD